MPELQACSAEAADKAPHRHKQGVRGTVTSVDPQLQTGSADLTTPNESHGCGLPTATGVAHPKPQTWLLVAASRDAQPDLPRTICKRVLHGRVDPRQTRVKAKA